MLERPWPAAIEAVLTQQVREPATERRLRAGIPALTPIEDGVSLMVRQQYEENPYPRWVKAASPSKATTINARLRHHFPFSRFRDLAQERRATAAPSTFWLPAAGLVSS